MDPLKTQPLSLRPVGLPTLTPGPRIRPEAPAVPSEIVEIGPLPPAPPQAPAPAPAPAQTAEPPLSVAVSSRPASFSPTLAVLEEPPGAVEVSGPPALTLEQQLQALATEASDNGKIRTQMRDLEYAYLRRFPYKDGAKAEKVREQLRGRYADSRVSAERVNEALHRVASQSGIDLKSTPVSLSELPFDNATLHSVNKELNQLIDKFWASDQGSQNPLKAQMVRDQTSRYLELIGQAQQQDDPGATRLADGKPKQLSAGAVYALVSRNIAALALQDQAACENNLGDHGVRHLVGHNIAVCEQLLDGLENSGAGVSAKDRLILHQAMIMHDLGYSTQNVRGGINFDGINGQDAGHPLLAGRYLREVFESLEDPVHHLFSPEDMKLMHRCVMYHDVDENGGAGIQLHTSARPTFEQRQQTLESVTRLADNTHAFEDKLPEVLYRHPASIKMLRLIKSAGELGDESAETHVRQSLLQQIRGREDLSALDKQALEQAVAQSGAQTLDFTVRRILGNRPQYEVNSEGKVTVTVEESRIHKEVMALCGQPELALLEKYVKDVSGVKLQIQPGVTELQTPGVNFRLKVGSQRAQEMTEFQSQLSGLFADPKFRHWATQDNQLGKTQKALEAIVNGAQDLDDAAVQKAAAKYLDPTLSCASREEILEAVGEQLGQVRSDRSGALRTYLGLPS